MMSKHDDKERNERIASPDLLVIPDSEAPAYIR
jgi:hypothetical protein